jgi:tetratricopeptide (TPR) repeat protein
MAQKGHWRLLLLLILLFGGLFFTRNLWQPWLFGIIFPRQQKLESIKLVVDLVNGIGALFPLLYGAYKFFLIKPKEKSSDFPKILTPTSPDKILTDYVSANPEEITWLDRQIVTTSNLRSHQCILLVGRMKSGKTREAAELIRKALSEEMLIPTRIYDITPGVRGFTPEVIQSALNRDLDRGTRVLFFINDLPKQSTGKQIESLTEFLKALEQCSPGYFLATARSDHLETNPELKKWLEQNDVKLIEMKPLEAAQRGFLVDELSRNHRIVIDEGAKKVLIEESDGTPYHLILATQYLAKEEVREITREQAEAVVSLSSQAIWTDIRNELKRIEPATVSLLEALAVFYHANVTPYYEIVLAYAAYLEGIKRRYLLPWVAGQKVNHAVKIVQPYGIYYKSPFVFPDVAVETLVPVNEGLPRLEHFVRNYRRFYRNRALRKFDSQAIQLQNTLFDLGTSYYFAKNLKKAEEQLKLALEIGQESETIWYDLGILLNDQGCKGEAERAYRQALQANPKFAQAWSNLGVLLFDLGRKDEAEASYRQALQVDPRYASAWSNLGNLLGDLGRKDEAEAAYLKAVQVYPKFAQAWSNLGNLLSDLGRKDEAEAAYRQALQTNPRYASAWYNLGGLLDDLGRRDEAEDSYRQALQADPMLVQAWSDLGVLLKDQGREDEAETAYLQALQIDPQNANVWSNLGLLLNGLGRKKEAEDAYRHALDANPQDANTWYNLGNLLGDLGRKGEAETAYRQALQVNPKFAQAWSNLGVLVDDLGRRDEAETAFRQALQADPQYAQAWSNLGIFLRTHDRLDEACGALEQAVLHAPDDSICHAGLGAVYRKLGRHEEATQEFTRARELSKDESTYNRACIAALCGEVETTFQLLEDAILKGEVTKDWVRHDPDWEDYQEDDRFIQLTKE